ncbi:hypothetical protein [uncultured Phascolarctobacterium sp.]|uniref:hypothetical protein n=1 Tax=uncultured Phascolarctobacterium sp. TaxID=512296 RepID=UPI0025CBB37F|nr:hypothetical protein [uncultured Phascolarctobacterium sp.]
MDWSERKTFVEETLKSIVLATELKYLVADLTLYRRMGREGIKVTYHSGKTRRIHGVHGVPLSQLAAMVFAETKWMHFNHCDYSGGGTNSLTDDEYCYWNIAGTRLKDKVKFRSTYLFNGEQIIVEDEVLVREGCRELLTAYMAEEFTEVATKCIQGKLKFINSDNCEEGNFENVNVYNDAGELIYRCYECELKEHLVSVEVTAIERYNKFGGLLQSV